MQKLLVTLIFLFTGAAVFAQMPKAFTENKQVYLEELTKMFEANSQPSKLTDIFQTFAVKWKTMGPEDEKFVYQVSNLMLKKSIKTDPGFYQFLSTVYYFNNEAEGAANYEKWKQIIKLTAESRSKIVLERYIDAVYLLMRDKTIYQSASVTWAASLPNFELQNDSLPSIIFKDITLSGKTKGDFTNIQGTSGIYYPSTYQWIGEKGNITWERAGLNPAANFASFGVYEFGLNGTQIEIDSATLHCEFNQKELLGKLSEKMMSTAPERADYPVFNSYDKRVKVEEIIPNIDYAGGFSLRGSRFAGIGSPGEPAVMIFKKDGKSFLEATSLNFLFDTAKVVAPLAKINIKLGKDSIIHAGLKLRYDKSDNTVDLIKDESSGSYGPMYSSYHELDFFVDRLTWKNGDSLIEMGCQRGSASTVATFESNNFFVKDRYKALQFPGESNHPLVLLRDFSISNRTKEFTIQEFSEFLRADITTTKQFIIDLANKGFLNYDFDEEYIILKDKLFDFLSANSKKIDYDVILFSSKVKTTVQPNATLNVKNFDLNIYGVDQIMLSDSQAVTLFADRRTKYITVKKNRNMEFAGVLRAGGFDFYGDSFRFNYDKFKVDLLKVDSVALYVTRKETDTSGTRERFVQIQTKINDITGELFIDNPINKSGVDNKNNRQFPILKTNEPSYAYYDKKSTHNGIYEREKFHFKIDPFYLDSLDNFNQNVLRFTGTMVSQGIFPDFVDSLSVQADYSLGFKHQTPAEGLALYTDKATFNNEIQLSDKGLMGNGDIIYVTSTSSSPRFTFFPDSTTGIAQKMENIAQTAAPDVPQATGKDFDFKLDPVVDRMVAKTIKTKIDMFAGEGHAEGVMVLNHDGLTSAGTLDMFDGKLTSARFRYNNSNAFCDTASFQLNSIGNKGLAISTDQVSAQIDFNYRIGTFRALNGEAKINFPKNQYVAFMDTYKWLVDEKKVELSSTATEQDTTGNAGSRFISVHPDQDSLSFRVPRAIYDVNTYIIRCKEVKNILVADVLVAPKNGDVNIMPDAVIETLQDATITADFINRFHTIYNATVELISAKKYLGRGNYNYEDDQKNQQKISFETISVDSARHTVAKGKIPEEMKFKLNQYFDYRGDVTLHAQDKGLFFDGSTRILMNCDKIERNWLAFSGQVDPTNVLIPVGTQMKSDLGQALGAGIMLQTTDSVMIYPTFISAKINPTDTQITTAQGYLWYNATDKTYNIGSKERFENKGLIGNIVTLNTQTCDITANGALGFGAPLGQVKTSMVGNAKFSYKEESTQMNGLLMADFYFDKKMLEYLSTKAAAYPFLQPVNISSTQFEKALTDYAPKQREELMEELNKKGVLGDIPDAMHKSLVFADVKFVWDDNTSSFVSTGDIGLLNTLDKPIMIYVKGKIQVLRSRRGNELVMYLEFDSNNWYFFKYKLDDKPRMQFYSSDGEFMKLFETVKEKDRKQDTRKNEATYEYEIAPRTARDSFFERFE